MILGVICVGFLGFKDCFLVVFFDILMIMDEDIVCFDDIILKLEFVVLIIIDGFLFVVGVVVIGVLKVVKI